MTSVERRESDEFRMGRGVEVCAVWLVADEAARITGQPGEVDLAGDWKCEKLGLYVDTGGLFLRKGKDVAKLTIEDRGPFA